MANLRWDGDDFRNEQDSSGTTADVVSHSGKLQQGYSHGSLTHGLAVYYSMKSGSGDFVDETELDNPATVYGASWSSDSKVGDYSLDFNGSGDYAEASNCRDHNPAAVFLSEKSNLQLNQKSPENS